VRAFSAVELMGLFIESLVAVTTDLGRAAPKVCLGRPIAQAPPGRRVESLGIGRAVRAANAPNKANSCVSGLKMRVGAENKANPGGRNGCHCGLGIGDWGFDAVDAWKVATRNAKQSQFAVSRLPRRFAARNERGGCRTHCAKQSQFVGGRDSPRRRGNRRGQCKCLYQKELRSILCVLCASVLKDRPLAGTEACERDVVRNEPNLPKARTDIKPVPDQGLAEECGEDGRAKTNPIVANKANLPAAAARDDAAAPRGPVARAANASRLASGVGARFVVCLSPSNEGMSWD